MICPKCSLEFNDAETDTCPACHHQTGNSMYLDASVKIDDNSIIVDENIAAPPDRPATPGNAQAPDMPIDAVYKKIIDSNSSAAAAAAVKAPGHAAPPPSPHQERRKAPRQTFKEPTSENKPAAATGAKSLAISVCIGAILLMSVIGAGIYYLKYNASDTAPAQIGSKPLILPAPAAPAPAYKIPPEATPLNSVKTEANRPLEAAQPTPQPAVPAPEKAPEAIADAARQEIKTEHAQEPDTDIKTQQREAFQASQAKPGSTPPARENMQPGSYILLCGSFKSKQTAQNTAEKLKQQHYPAVMEEADLGAKGVWYRIKVGGFSSKDATEKTRLEIKRKFNIDALASTKK